MDTLLVEKTIIKEYVSPIDDPNGGWYIDDGRYWGLNNPDLTPEEIEQFKNLFNLYGKI